MVLLRRSEGICRDQGSQGCLQRVLGRQVLILEKQGDLRGAATRLEEKRDICSELGLRVDLERSVAKLRELQEAIKAEKAPMDA